MLQVSPNLSDLLFSAGKPAQVDNAMQGAEQNPVGAPGPESELAHRRGLVMAYSARSNFRPVVILSTNGAAGQSTKDCNLPRVREGVCNRALE